MVLINAGTAGFCFGVKRAVDMCEESLEKYGSCVSFGPIIHNRIVTDALEKKGLSIAESVNEIKKGQHVIIRSHGIGKNDYETLLGTGADLIDATCPYVKKIHDIVSRESAEGRFIIIVGDPEHAEIRASSEWCGDCFLAKNTDSLLAWFESDRQNKDRPVSVVFQTTETRDVFETTKKLIKKECTNSRIFDTICGATFRRQKEAAEIAEKTDAMIVLGGSHSANSAHLADICRERCGKVYFVETADDLDYHELASFKTIGITAGASTPACIIKEVNHKMEEEIRIDAAVEQAQESAAEAVEAVEAAAETAIETSVEEIAESVAETVAEPVEAAVEAAEEAVEKAAADETPAESGEVAESFEEMLEKSIKTIYTGQKVTGVVAAITPTEVSVDLGTKQSGYIPISELTDDPNAKAEDIVKVGDEIETYVMRVNDVEGTVMLSKRRLDSSKSWEVIEQLRADKVPVEGTVVEENKGGIVVSVKGVRVFVPASQVGLPKDEPMSKLIKTKVKLFITEVNQSRRRVVGSIRAAEYEERRAKAEVIWNEIEVGKVYTGTVKSMTSYGAFVDIGGIDGMIHVSELSWTRIKQPSDVLNIGDTIEVYVLSFDKEKKKISLGYKKEEDNPWVKFTNACAVGDVVNVKVVKLMPFGAFAEIIPGVDGLIHISQITDHRIGTPAEVLSDGQQLDVKITDIDFDKHKVSLSARALIEGDNTVPTVEEPEMIDEPVEDVAPEADAAPETESETSETAE